MPSATEIRAEIRTRAGAELEAYLLSNSGLPGPRANLALVAAAADVVPDAQLRTWAALGPDDAPGSTPREFLPVCGVVGLGRILAEANAIHDSTTTNELWPDLGRHASDPRWRVREAVAMALQRLGAADFSALMDGVAGWAASGDRWLQRATVAALCEPPILREAGRGEAVVAVLDQITASVERAAGDERHRGAFRVLRQALGYGWSVAIVAAPDAGKAAFERWAASADGDMRWIVRENLRKARLTKLDAAWVRRLQAAAARSS